MTQLEHPDFQPLIDQAFASEHGDFILTSTTERAANPDASQGFSLVFRGPAGLPQQLYELDHPTLGSHGIFLVPIAEETYEAVFTR